MPETKSRLTYKEELDMALISELKAMVLSEKPVFITRVGSIEIRLVKRTDGPLKRFTMVKRNGQDIIGWDNSCSERRAIRMFWSAVREQHAIYT